MWNNHLVVEKNGKRSDERKKNEKYELEVG